MKENYRESKSENNRVDDTVAEVVGRLGDWFNDKEAMETGRMTSDLYPYESLFEPIYINRLKIKNRIVMGPMGNVCMADEMGKPSSKMIKYFVERAKGGAGLITSGMVPVSVDDDPSYGDLHATGIFPRIDKHRSVYAGWRAIAEGCHAHGARFFIQLSPGMGRVGNPECLTKKMKMPISASWNNNWYIPQIPCRPITDRACKKIIRHTGQAAIDAKEMGIDGVYLHGHSGYLIEQMTDPAYNRRKLGRYADWQNFGLDLVREIRQRCGPSYPIHYRIDLSLGLKETYGEKMKDEKVLRKYNNGRTVAMTLEYMENLVEVGVDAFDVDLGGYENWWMPHPPNGMPPGVYLGMAQLVKKHFKERGIKSKAGFDVPIIGVGKLGFPNLAEGALRREQCDMVMLSRPLLADPFWPAKAYAGKVDEIRPCIGDHEGCLGQLAIGGHPHCAVNPRTAFEDVYQDDMKPVEKAKRVAVIGAGPGGVVLACTLSVRGHSVDLYDRNGKAGGSLLYGGVPKIKYEVANYIDYLNNEIRMAEKAYNLTAKFNTTATEPLLKGEGYDIIVTCSGTQPIIPKIDGVDRANVVTGVDFLKRPEMAEDKEEVVVIGGSDVGCEIAYMLGFEMDKKVTVVEMGSHFMKKTCTSNRHYMIHHLEKRGIELLNCTTLMQIKDTSVVLSRNVSKTVPNPYITWTPVLAENIVNPFEKSIKEDYKTLEIPAELVILSTGAVPNDKLYEICLKRRTAPEIYNIGDSFSTGRVLEAVKAGYALGNSI